MDVFNSALRNPLPPSKRQYRRSGDSGPTSDEEATASGPGSPKQLSSSARHDGPDLRTNHKKKTSRRKHRNSHLGCGICKKRRIKCDENLPQCFNCVKGKLQCAYLKLDAPARNALRMAQYNQNLRDDKQDELPYTAELAPPKYPLNEPQLDVSQAPIIMNHHEYYSPYAPNRMTPISQSYLPVQDGAAFQAPGQYPPEANVSKLVNSPYGPVVQFQSLAPGLSYAVPFQIMNGSHVMYQGPEHLQYSVPNPQMQTLPPRNLASLPMHPTPSNSGVPYNQAPQLSYEAAYYPAHGPVNGHMSTISQSRQSVAPVDFLPGANMAYPVPHDHGEVNFNTTSHVSLSASPPSALNTPLISTKDPSRASSTEKDVSSSATSNTNSELGLRPRALDAVSDATSPSLRSAVRTTSSQNTEADHRFLQNASHQGRLPESDSIVTLAPIRTKNEPEKESTPEDVKEAEKVPSIRMLLS